LPHHSNVVPIRKVLSDFAIEHPIHVHVLNLEAAPGRLHTDEHSAIDRKVWRTPVGATIRASDNDPLALRKRVQRRELRLREVGLDLSQHRPHASTPNLSAVILAVLGEVARCRVEVAAIERLIEFFGDAPIGLGWVYLVSRGESADFTLYINRNAAISP
jgi:hypothetical protein